MPSIRREVNLAYTEILRSKMPEWQREKRIEGRVVLGLLAVDVADTIALQHSPNNPIENAALLLSGVLTAAYAIRRALSAETVAEYQHEID